MWFIFCKFTPPLFPFNTWRVLVLKFFGAKIEWSSKIYPSANIFMPWNLEMKKNSCLGKNVDCYNYDKKHWDNLRNECRICIKAYNKKNRKRISKKYLESQHPIGGGGSSGSILNPL